MSKAQRMNALITKMGQIDQKIKALSFEIYSDQKETGYCDEHKACLLREFQRQYAAANSQYMNLAY